MSSSRHPSTMSTRRHRRRVLVLNRVENHVPGRVAFVIHRGRSRSRDQSSAAYRAMARWALERSDRIDYERHAPDEDRDPADLDLTNTQDEDVVEPDPDPGTENVPGESWTKGELYERARELDIQGRSKMNKDELLDAVQRAERDSGGDETMADRVAAGAGQAR